MFKIDAAVKLVIMIFFIIALFLSDKILSIIIIIAVVSAASILLNIKKKIVIKTLLYSFIVLVLPYIFGFIISSLFVTIPEIDVRLLMFKIVKLTLLGYMTSLYFYSAPINIIASLFDKLFSPLKCLNIPVSDYIRFLILIINEVTKGLDNFKNAILCQIKSFKGLINLIVNMIVNSLNSVDDIEKKLNDKDIIDLDSYHFKFTRNEFFLLSVVAVILFFIASIG